MKIAHRQMYREVGCIGNTRSYPHDSLIRVKYQVLAANSTSRAELLDGGLGAEHIKSSNTNIVSFGTRHEDYGFVSDGWRSLQHYVRDIWRPATNVPRVMATRTG
ncbi:hypothetical protein ARMSODRAFT_351665 [Armillaria solidipes]|uniref:Uncharacterized protein n=1 Tax=Armillaria solidipes TaxID=1076256 RepID=A0A2H3BKL6_9AGAR|nr:hypothetical protein ARMSODRAFT_351665 [Armillaria solidipes]